MAAISTAIMAMAKQGQVLAQDALYGCSSQLLFEQAPHWGIEADFIDFTDVHAFQKKFNPWIISRWSTWKPSLTQPCV